MYSKQSSSFTGVQSVLMWSLASGLFVICALALALALFLPSSIDVMVLEPSLLPIGPWTADDPVFAYFDDLTTIEVDAQPEATVLRISSDNQGSGKYNGFGVVGSFDVSNRSRLRIVWRGKVSGPALNIHLVDASPGRTRIDGGEIFTAVAPQITSTWQRVDVSLSDFERDTTQPDDAPTDGNLDTDGISNVEIGFESGTRLDLEIRSISFRWEASRAPTYLTILFGGIAGALLLANAPRFGGGTPVPESPTNRVVEALGYLFVSCVLVGGVLRSSTFSLSILEASALGGMFVLLVLSDYLRPVLRQRTFWSFRYVLFVSVILAWAGTDQLLLPFLLLFVALPTATLTDRRLIPVAALLPVSAILIAQPVSDLQGKGTPLLYVLAVSLGAIGVSEALKGSEIRKRHQQTSLMYRGILEQIDDGVLLVDRRGCVELANRGIERLLSVDRGELQGQAVGAFIRTQDGTPFRVSEAPSSHAKIEVALVSPGTGDECEALLSAHILDRDSAQHVQLVITDISDRKRMEYELERANERLRRLAETDALTGLDNRRAFEQVLNDEWRRCARTGVPLTLLYIDIDAFKAYNDDHGHAAGDQVLKRVSSVLASHVRRPGDRLARYGGEEFLVILPDTGILGLEAYAEQIRKGVEGLGIQHPKNPAASVVTVSIGAASCIPELDQDPGRLLHVADTALYAAKRRGRNCISIHPGEAV